MATRLLRCVILFLLALSLAGAAAGPRAASVSELLGEPVRNERGERVGSISDIIVDVRAGRVLYLIVDAAERFYTFPIGALGKDMRVDMRRANEAARLPDEADPRFRRARKLLGEPVVHLHPRGAKRLGGISDLEFDPASGEVNRVIVTSAEGDSGYPPGVLAHGRFPPLGGPYGPYPDAEAIGERGYVRREPSDDRRRLHEPDDW